MVFTLFTKFGIIETSILFGFSAEPAPLNRNEILFVYHREAEVWTERNLVNRLLEMRASITTKLIHQLYSGGKTKEELAVESLKKCNHAVVVLSRKFAECELSFYLLGYIVNSFRKKLVTVQAEDCDPPSIIGHLGILKLDSPNFWRNLVAGIDEELDQATGKYSVYIEYIKVEKIHFSFGRNAQ